MITMSCSIDKKALLLVVFLCKENQSFFFKNLEKTENTLFLVYITKLISFKDNTFKAKTYFPLFEKI